jgi:hypothetical protein
MFRSWSSFGRRWAVVAAGLCIVMFGRSTEAHTFRTREAPTNLVINDQYFDGNVAGLRMYLESIRTTNPDLYTQLVPAAERLESQVTIARTALVAGMGVGLALILTGVLTRAECTLPQVGAANFSTGAAEWESCNRDNMTRLQLFSVAGIVALLGGGVTALVTSPRRQDLLDVVNQHNRVNPEPLRLQIGYDPNHRFARAGVALTF